MNVRLAIFILICLALSSAREANASWVSDAFGLNVDLAAGKIEFGTPDPVGAIQRLPAAVQRLPQDFANLGNPPGLALAFAVRQAKAQAAFGARAMPPDVYQQLTQYFSPAFLQSVAFNTFSNARITLDSAVMLLNNDVAAITLEDIVVFRNESDAHNPVLWAHELTHVQQYRNRGVDAFANMYTTNAWVLENEAIDTQNRVGQAIASAAVQQQNFAYFWVGNQYLYGDAYGNLYPADPRSGNVVGPANGRIFVRYGQWVAQDSSGRLFVASRVL
jgi:hypothetical protein